ncbi:MAG: penicillin-binding protein 1C [Chloroflexi bacterium]|nr:penicillin-binding protein 1C [Chloroflexota bacterium]
MAPLGEPKRYWVYIFAVLLGTAILTGMALVLATPSPPPPPQIAESTKIFDRRGRLLYEILLSEKGSHTDIALSSISRSLRQATIATEDASFYHNHGFNILAISRALVQNLLGGQVVSGGSTITQQLARELYFTPQERASQSLTRKLWEIILAFRLSSQLSKDKILELYLNRVYYGHLAYGVEAAARTYFGKSAQNLDLAEASLLAGLPQSPARYDPFTHGKTAQERQAIVLSRMKEEGYISEGEAKAALDEPLRLAPAPFPINAPHFVAYVRQWIEDQLGPDALEQGGLRIYTTLDLDMQITAENLVQRRLFNLQEHDASDASLIALDVATGQVLAMVGSADYFDESIDGAVNMALARRQPGSAMKPIAYALALSQGYTAATPILDVPSTFLTRHNQPYAPNNYDATFHGPVSLRYALASSFNVPAIRVTQDIGVDGVLRLARDLGITTLGDGDRYDLSLTLGGGEVSLLELTLAYAAFASGGQGKDVAAVMRVEAARGGALYRWQPTSERQAISPQVAYLITSILSDNQARAPAFGHDSPLRLSRPAAAKTGTTSDFRDNWTVGYTPDLAVGVWVGNADNRSMRQVSGISGAAPLWHDFMEEILKMTPARDFDVPQGLVEEEICEPTGLKPGPWCPERRLELFIAGTQPTATESYYRPLPICLLNGQLSTSLCPPQYVVEKVFTFVPPEAIPWAMAAGLPLPPQFAPPPEGESNKPQEPWVSLVSPGPETILAISREIPPESQQLVLEAATRGLSALEKVEVYDNDSLLATRWGAPYLFAWPLAAGEHIFQAVAYVNEERRTQSQPVRILVLP